MAIEKYSKEHEWVRVDRDVATMDSPQLSTQLRRPAGSAGSARRTLLRSDLV